MGILCRRFCGSGLCMPHNMLLFLKILLDDGAACTKRVPGTSQLPACVGWCTPRTAWPVRLISFDTPLSFFPNKPTELTTPHPPCSPRGPPRWWERANTADREKYCMEATICFHLLFTSIYRETRKIKHPFGPVWLTETGPNFSIVFRFYSPANKGGLHTVPRRFCLPTAGCNHNGAVYGKTAAASSFWKQIPPNKNGGSR